MDILYAPWRDAYVRGKSGADSEDQEAPRCPFCIKDVQKKDRDLFVLKRYEHCFVIMNLYPYAAGHLLVVPYRHVAALSDFSSEERAEFFEVASLAAEALTATLQAHGINLGMNLGKAAGAGIPDHLHLHAVPRWIGDTNFLPIVAKTKQISVDLHHLYDRLLKAF